MAFNIQTFRIRALTAIVFVAIMLAGLLWNQWSFLVLFSIIHFGCWLEYLKLTEKIHSTFFHPYTKIGLMVMGYGIMLWFCSPAFHISGYGLKENISLPVSAAGFGLLLTGIFQKNPINIKAFGYAVLGLLYISLSLGLLVSLSGLTENPDSGERLFSTHNYIYPLIIIFSIWVNDTMAYIVGSIIGKRPLSRISPKKTWEGTIGGIILCVALAFFIPFLFSIEGIDPGSTAVVALSVALFGTIGDLFESKLKRMAKVKDSGNFMPGHGGFLDRFDSLLFAIPIAWILLYPCLFGPC